MDQQKHEVGMLHIVPGNDIGKRRLLIPCQNLTVLRDLKPLNALPLLFIRLMAIRCGSHTFCSSFLCPSDTSRHDSIGSILSSEKA